MSSGQTWHHPVTAIRPEIDPNRSPDSSSSNSRFDTCASHKSGSGRILQQLLYDCADDLVTLLCRHAVSDFQLKPDRPGEHISRRLCFRVLLAVTIDVPGELCRVEQKRCQ